LKFETPLWTLIGVCLGFLIAYFHYRLLRGSQQKEKVVNIITQIALSADYVGEDFAIKQIPILIAQLNDDKQLLVIVNLTNIFAQFMRIKFKLVWFLFNLMNRYARILDEDIRHKSKIRRRLQRRKDLDKLQRIIYVLALVAGYTIYDDDENTEKVLTRITEIFVFVSQLAICNGFKKAISFMFESIDKISQVLSSKHPNHFDISKSPIGEPEIAYLLRIIKLWLEESSQLSKNQKAKYIEQICHIESAMIQKLKEITGL